MASKTKEMRRQEEEINKRIVDAHRRGVCDRDGNPIPPRVYGCGQLHCGLSPWGSRKLNVWPRDERGRLVGD